MLSRNGDLYPRWGDLASYAGVTLSPEAAEAFRLMWMCPGDSPAVDICVRRLQAWAMGEFLTNGDRSWYDDVLAWIESEKQAVMGG